MAAVIEQKPSEEILNAFVDGEFSPEDRLHTLQFIAASERLSREICDLYQLKELVNLAYREGIVSRSRFDAGVGGRRVGVFRAAAAAVGILSVGVILWAVHGGWKVPGGIEDGFGIAVQDVVQDVVQEVVQETDRANVFLPAGLGQAAGRVLLHVTDVGIADAESLFDDIEFLFEDAKLRGRDLRIQVVVHGNSMDLVRADLAPFPARMRGLLDAYPGLRLTACGQSRARFSRGERRSIELLPWVEEVESGIREAALKQLEGWAYIRL